MPYIHSLDSEPERELYAQFNLILFKPFRNINDLLAEYVNTPTPWWPAYNAYKQEFTSESIQIISFLNDYHECRVRAASKHLDTNIDHLDHIIVDTPMFAENEEYYVGLVTNIDNESCLEVNDNILKYPSTGMIKFVMYDFQIE
jgi:hypothetical protein